MKLIDPKDLKEYILTNYDQVTIFSTYLEIPESDINYCLENKSNKICNPIRDDQNPSLGFIFVQDRQSSLFKLKMYDFADPYYRGDCFDLVGIIRSLNSNKGNEFIAICNDIIYTLKTKTLHESTKNIEHKVKNELFTEIHIEPRLWNGKDIDLWNTWGHPFNEIKHLIFPLKHSFISNYCDYTYSENDPCYSWITGYYDNKTLYKEYFPFRTGKEPMKPRFKTNNKYYPLECIHELKPADILVITKSYKDKLLITKLLYSIKKEHTIVVTNFTSESVILSDNFALNLFNIYPNIVVNTDFDHTGLHTSGIHKHKFGMIRFMFTNGRWGTYDFGAKDICDIYTKHGFQYCVDIIQEAYNYLKETIYEETNQFTRDY